MSLAHPKVGCESYTQIDQVRVWNEFSGWRMWNLHPTLGVTSTLISFYNESFYTMQCQKMPDHFSLPNSEEKDEKEQNKEELPSFSSVSP